MKVIGGPEGKGKKRDDWLGEVTGWSEKDSFYMASSSKWPPVSLKSFVCGKKKGHRTVGIVEKSVKLGRLSSFDSTVWAQSLSDSIGVEFFA